MQLKLYDTPSRKKRVFEPINPERVTLYVCGPTVYDFAHIGNFRPPIVFDVLFRMLRHIYGEDHVLYAANVTDVDDKINRRAHERGIEINELTQAYIDAYNVDSQALGNLPVTFQPKATETIESIVAMISRLVSQGAAYSADGHVLFDTAAFPDYGKFSARKLEDLIEGARVEVAPYKRDPRDFVLWKPSKENEPHWPSPWGPGRPGWHIECTAMIEDTLGLPIDIHGGGSDLIFPHHENEVAQGLCAGSCDAYANYWMHNGMLNIGEAKMSKSFGETLTAHELLEHFPGEVLRWSILAGHYRASIEWKTDVLEQSWRSLDRLYGALWRSMEVEVNSALFQPSEPFILAMFDDLNTPRALSELFSLAGALETAKPNDKARLKCELLCSGQLLGLLKEDPNDWFQRNVSEELRANVEGLLKQRAKARSEKDWSEADRIRDALSDKNIEVMDGPDGVRWRLSTKKS